MQWNGKGEILQDPRGAQRHEEDNVSYKTSPHDLKTEESHRRQYYERNNHLICSYLYIDRLLDSSLPHSLLQEYTQPVSLDAYDPKTIVENSALGLDEHDHSANLLDRPQDNGYSTLVKVKRTPRDIYKVPDEETALLGDENGPKALELAEEEDAESGSPVVTVAIYINLAANAVLLVGKIVGHLAVHVLPPTSTSRVSPETGCTRFVQLVR